MKNTFISSTWTGLQNTNSFFAKCEHQQKKNKAQLESDPFPKI